MRLLSGIAGGGKTTVLNTVAKIYQAEGLQRRWHGSDESSEEPTA